MLQQMMEMRSWKTTQGLIKDGNDGMVEHLVAGYTNMSISGYLATVLMILAITWAKNKSWLELARGVQKTMGVRNGFGEWSGKTCIGFTVQLAKNADSKKTQLDTRSERRKEDLDKLLSNDKFEEQAFIWDSLLRKILLKLSIWFLNSIHFGCYVVDLVTEDYW